MRPWYLLALVLGLISKARSQFTSQERKDENEIRKENAAAAVSKFDKKHPTADWHGSLKSWRNIPKAQAVGMCLTTRDDNPFLREWVEFYLRVMGVGAIYVYDGKSQVPQKSEIEDWVDRGRVKYEYVTDQISTQNYGYPDCFDRYAKKHRWLVLLDIDEFISLPNVDPSDPYPLATFLDTYEEYASIKVSWVNLGSDGHLKRPPAGVVDSYVGCTTGYNLNFKNICNTLFAIRHGHSKDASVTPHRCKIRPRRDGVKPKMDEKHLTRLGLRTDKELLTAYFQLYHMSNDPPPSREQAFTEIAGIPYKSAKGLDAVFRGEIFEFQGHGARIFHYVSKSREDFEVKMRRGGGVNGYGHKDNLFWKLLHQSINDRNKTCTQLRDFTRRLNFTTSVPWDPPECLQGRSPTVYAGGVPCEIRDANTTRKAYVYEGPNLLELMKRREPVVQQEAPAVQPGAAPFPPAPPLDPALLQDLPPVIVVE